MSQTTLEMAKELVVAQIVTNALSPDEVQSVLRQTHTILLGLKAKEERREAAPKSVDWKRSITRYTITCLECGETLKQLSGLHLKRHGLDARAYRAKYSIPRTQPLAAEETTARRQQIAHRVRPWENAPMFMKAQKDKSQKKTATTERPMIKRADTAHA